MSSKLQVMQLARSHQALVLIGAFCSARPLTAGLLQLACCMPRVRCPCLSAHRLQPSLLSISLGWVL